MCYFVFFIQLLKLQLRLCKRILFIKLCMCSYYQNDKSRLHCLMPAHVEISNNKQKNIFASLCPRLRFLWFNARIIYDFIQSMLDFLVHSLYETKKSYMIPVWLTRILHLVFINHFFIYVFYSVGHHLSDSLASHCDPKSPPKDPNVQYHLQTWALNKKVSPNTHNHFFKTKYQETTDSV